MPFQIDENALQSILNEVEEGLLPVLKSEKDRLVKADDESAPPSKDEGSAPPSKDEGSSPADEGSAPPAEGSSPAGGDAPPPPPGPEASASPEGSAPPPGAEGSAPAGGLPADPAQLAQAIAQMPPEQVKAVYMAAKQVLFSQMGAAPAGGPEASAPGAGAPPAGPEASAPPPPPPAAGPEASASAPPAPPFGKGEMKPSPGNGGKTAPVKKNENAEVAALKAELETLKKSQADQIKAQETQIGLLTKAVQHMAGQPIRKAVTSVAHLAKSETTPTEGKSLSKAEMTQRLKDKIREGSLSKKDKEAVRKFYDTGSHNFDLVKHLLVAE